MWPWEMPTYWNQPWFYFWFVGSWWEYSQELKCEVDSLCILGFCFERPISIPEKMNVSR
jgi:hypothetical protein